uniref:Ectonucleoside triphosphate diphosphohydrolase 5b n=1 Tax=Sinocyclocheilus grahami TaxID=75366 RepID=A0A672K4D2_SINGR
IESVLCVCVCISASSSQRNGLNAVDFSERFGNALPSLSRPANASRIFYSIMFDAGSTGTRIHVYTFIQKEPGESCPALHRQQGIEGLKPITWSEPTEI